ncbi:MAG: hypothetical protein AVDCRST_MAG56-2401, partial [uncultured Cytophagales bacterium]
EKSGSARGNRSRTVGRIPGRQPGGIHGIVQCPRACPVRLRPQIHARRRPGGRLHPGLVRGPVEKAGRAWPDRFAQVLPLCGPAQPHHPPPADGRPAARRNVSRRIRIRNQPFPRNVPDQRPDLAGAAAVPGTGHRQTLPPAAGSRLPQILRMPLLRRSGPRHATGTPLGVQPGVQSPRNPQAQRPQSPHRTAPAAAGKI